MPFGPLMGIRKQIRLAGFISAVPVTNPWTYGRIIPLTPHGWPSPIAGSEAVELPCSQAAAASGSAPMNRMLSQRQ
ncbi:MAG: hypothetical protein METHP_01648 [Methanoregula sp. SKADARSKE-2]|nr:MAG: hypothetical protein METHP_01648 [Methanoregula sp. SKADARSKE-2]